MLTLARVRDDFGLERLALANELDDCTMEYLVLADIDLRDGSIVCEVGLKNRDDIDNVASDGWDAREMMTRLDVFMVSLLGNGDSGLPFAIDVGVEDEASDTEIILLAGLPDELESDALAAVRCSSKLDDEEERLDKVDCTDDLYDEEEQLADVCCTDNEVVKEPLQ